MLDLYKPVVWEFARLNVTHNVMSKRKLLKLVNEQLLHGWDDPRALTLAGMRRRGVTPQVWVARVVSVPLPGCEDEQAGSDCPVVGSD